jgi:hypothetical protein
MFFHPMLLAVSYRMSINIPKIGNCPRFSLFEYRVYKANSLTVCKYGVPRGISGEMKEGKEGPNLYSYIQTEKDQKFCLKF